MTKPAQVAGSTCEAPPVGQPDVTWQGVRPVGSWKPDDEGWFQEGVLWTTIYNQFSYNEVQFSSVAQSCPTLCDPMNHSTPGLPVHHQHPEFTETHVH